MAAALAIASAAGGIRPAIAVTSAPGIPQTSTSFYVLGSFIDACGPNATTGCPLYVDATKEAVPPAGAMAILDFGAPCFEPATLAWGTQLFNSQSCTPNATLAILAQAWLRGYQANPNRSAQTSDVLVIGTSNSQTAAVPGYALTAAEMSAHGQAWFKSVVAPMVAYAQSIQSPVTIWAGDDIEESADGDWYDGATTTAWVDAYAAASGATKPCLAGRNGLMLDYGDYVPNEPGWSQAAVYHVAWQSAAACAMPEIYRTANAVEWQSLNQYAQTNALPQIQFTAILSQDGAAGSLSSSDSWNTFKGATGQAAPYMSVIGEIGPIPPRVPDAPTGLTAVPGRGLVTLSWSAPAWDGGAAVSSYIVTVYAGQFPAQVLAVSGIQESTSVAGLATGPAYTFYVIPINRAGAGPLSQPSTSVAPSAIFP